MYRQVTRVRCDICQTEKTLAPSDYYRGADFDSQCKRDGWVVVHNGDYAGHVCPECRTRVGYAHGLELVKAILQRFDPQTYGEVDELVWRVDDKYLSYAELVNLTHPKEKDRE